MRLRVFGRPVAGVVAVRAVAARDAHAPTEMRGSAVDGKVGSSGLARVHTRVLFGDPSKPGFYSILLFVPAHTTFRRTPIVMTAWPPWSPGRGTSAMATTLMRGL